MTIGSPVITVKAIDDDVGQNAEVRYRFKQDLMGDWKTFLVDEITGLITLKKSLNKEIQKIYQVPGFYILQCLILYFSYSLNDLNVYRFV